MRSETTAAYVELHGSEDALLSFRYVRPWIGAGLVLDLGCSKGGYLAQCKPGSVGVDVSKPNLDHCRKRGLCVIAADLNGELPFQNGSTSAILCSHVLEHVDAPINLLRECYRVLAEDGRLVLGLPIETSLVNWIRGENYFRDHPGHLYSFSLQNTKTILDRTGFQLCSVYFEPRVIRLRPWLYLMQHLPRSFVYPLAIAYWAVARKNSRGVAQSA